MKMKVGTRVVFTIYILVMVLFCLFLLATLFGLVNTAYLTDTTNTISNGTFWFKFLYAAIFIVLVVVGIALLFFGMKKENPKTAKIAEFENGSIVITVKAIEELVEKYVRDFEDIKGMHIAVISNTDTIDINLEVAVKPDTDIPALTKSLQSGLIESIQGHTGITVRKNKITVMGLDDKIKPAQIA